jgi:hypothetical protein
MFSSLTGKSTGGSLMVRAKSMNSSTSARNQQVFHFFELAAGGLIWMPDAFRIDAKSLNELNQLDLNSTLNI